MAGRVSDKMKYRAEKILDQDGTAMSRRHGRDTEDQLILPLGQGPHGLREWAVVSWNDYGSSSLLGGDIQISIKGGDKEITILIIN